MKIEIFEKKSVKNTLEQENILAIPHIVERYEKICPSAANKILTMTENELKNKN